MGITRIFKSKTNYIWVLDCIYYFSKFIQSYPLKNRDANDVLVAIKQFTYSLGFPNILQTDNGLEFVYSKLVKFCSDNNITFIQSRPINPKYNGIVEVYHKEIRKYVLTNYTLNETIYDENENDFNLKEKLD